MWLFDLLEALASVFSLGKLIDEDGRVTKIGCVVIASIILAVICLFVLLFFL